MKIIDRVKRFGKSLYVCIPKYISEKNNIVENSALEMEFKIVNQKEKKDEQKQ